MAAFSTQPTTGVGSITPTSSAFYLDNAGLTSQVSNWQAAIVTSPDGVTPIEFQLTGVKNTTIGGGTSEPVNPVLNGLQIVPVVAFLQPAVNANNSILEYGPLASGTYLLMHVQGAINVNGSQPSFAGGWYRLTYSTVDNPPTTVRINYPEINRYITGQAASQAYAGRSYQFTHAGGYIELSFDDIFDQYANVTTATGATNTSTYIEVGAAYPPDSPETDPIAPIFALINVTGLSTQGPAVNPVLFTPTYGQIPDAGLNVTMFSTTPSATIYYTQSSSTTSAEPAEAPNPVINSDGTAGAHTTIYTVPINVIKPTKFRAAAKATGLTNSPMSSVYYYDINTGDT